MIRLFFFVWYMPLLPLFLPIKMYCVYMFVAVVVGLLSFVVVNVYETKDKSPLVDNKL